MIVQKEKFAIFCYTRSENNSRAQRGVPPMLPAEEQTFVAKLQQVLSKDQSLLESILVDPRLTLQVLEEERQRSEGPRAAEKQKEYLANIEELRKSFPGLR